MKDLFYRFLTNNIESEKKNIESDYVYLQCW